MFAWRYVIWLALLGLYCLNTWAEEDTLPQAFTASRYESMRQHCPFAIATGTPAPAVLQPSFAANWFVSGIARVGDTEYVTVKARDQSSQFSLFGHEPNPQNQVAMVSIDWVEGIGKSTVTIKKGSETAKLEFNEAIVHGPPQGATAQNAPINANGPARTPFPVGGPKLAAVIGGPQPMQSARSQPIPNAPRPAVGNRVLPQRPTSEALPRRTLPLPRVPNN